MSLGAGEGTVHDDGKSQEKDRRGGARGASWREDGGAEGAEGCAAEHPGPEEDRGR